MGANSFFIDSCFFITRIVFWSVLYHGATQQGTLIVDFHPASSSGSLGETTPGAVRLLGPGAAAFAAGGAATAGLGRAGGGGTGHSHGQKWQRKGVQRMLTPDE